MSAGSPSITILGGSTSPSDWPVHSARGSSTSIQLDSADAVFADGFESGDTTAWSGIVSPFVESRRGFMVFPCREAS